MLMLFSFAICNIPSHFPVPLPALSPFTFWKYMRSVSLLFVVFARSSPTGRLSVCGSMIVWVLLLVFSASAVCSFVVGRRKRSVSNSSFHALAVIMVVSFVCVVVVVVSWLLSWLLSWEYLGLGCGV